MNIRIPYPIPQVDRERLIAAGKEACAQPDTSRARREAQIVRQKIEDDIRSRYGVSDLVEPK